MNRIEDWLAENERSSSGLNFIVIDISEKTKISESFKRKLASSLLQTFYPMDGLKRRIIKMPEAMFVTFLNNLFSPNRKGFDSAVRIGDWGEFFSGLYLQQVKGHKIPLYKIRYKHRNNKSVQMLDLLTFKENDNSIHFNEIKTRCSKLSMTNKFNSKYDVAKNAYQELISEYNADIPSIYAFISRIFDNEHNYNLADEFDKYILTNNTNKKGNIFLLFEKKYWNDAVINELNTINIEIQDLKVIVVLIEDLKTLIDETYKLTIDIAKELKNE